MPSTARHLRNENAMGATAMPCSLESLISSMSSSLIKKTTKGGMIMLTWQADLEAYVVRHGGRHVQFRPQMWDVAWNLSRKIGEACDLFLIVGS